LKEHINDVRRFNIARIYGQWEPDSALSLVKLSEIAQRRRRDSEDEPLFDEEMLNDLLDALQDAYRAGNVDESKHAISGILALANGHNVSEAAVDFLVGVYKDPRNASDKQQVKHVLLDLNKEDRIKEVDEQIELEIFKQHIPWHAW
jgi:hypothetical protein